MRDMSLHILDIAENSVNAGASHIEISIRESKEEDSFTLRVDDDGRGIDVEKKRRDPYFTSKDSKKFGLGIPLLKQAAEWCEGGFSLSPREEGGTTLLARFRKSHIDMKPLGDVGSTVAVLVAGHPDIAYCVRYERDGDSYRFDTAELRKELEDLPLETPAVLEYIRQNINDGIRRVSG
jgi:hypothetical protein